MNSTKTTFRLWHRVDKELKNSTPPVFLVCSVKGERKYFNTGVKIIKKQWHTERQQVKNISQSEKKAIKNELQKNGLLDRAGVTRANNELNHIIKIATDVETQFILDGVAFSSKMIIDALKEQLVPVTKTENGNGTIANWIDLYAEDCTDKKAGTIKCYTGLANHLKDFERYSNRKVTFQNFNYDMLEKFREYLITEKKQTNTTMIKQFSTMKTLLKRAEKFYGIEINQDFLKFENYQRKDSDFEVIVLTEEELNKMMLIDLSDNPRLDRQRDVFVFSASTGLRFSDLKDLKRVHIKDDAIEKVCFKTKQQLHVPLNDVSRAILDKYADDIMPLPIISNDKCRKYIKEVAKLCSINEIIEKVRYYGKKAVVTTKPKHDLIGIHTGRKTFVTVSLNNEMPQHTVMAWTGHKSNRSFNRYVDVAKKQMHEAMKKNKAFNRTTA